MPMSPEVAKMLAQAFLSEPAPEKEAAIEDPPLVAPPLSQQEQAKQYATEFRDARPQSTAPLESQREQAPVTQQSLQDEYNAKEEALEARLRAEDEAEQSGQGAAAPPPELNAPMQSENPTAIVTPEQAANQSAAAATAAHQDIETNAQNERETAQQKAATEGAIAADSQQHIDHLASDISARHDHLLAVQQQVEQAQADDIANYQKVNAEMMNMAVAQPKDIYGAAGVNSILGRVAVFLGGAGSNGFGPNRNLEYIEQMANHNVSQLRQRYDMLAKVGEGQRTLYGMLNTRLSNAYQVDATLKNMSLEVYKANIMSVANKYSDQTTKQAANTEVNKINALQAQNNLGVEQQKQKEAQQNMANYAQFQANATRAYAAQVKAKTGSGALLHLQGFVGGVPKEEHARLSKMVAGSRILVDGINQMESLIKHGASPADVRRYFVQNAILFKGARDFLETGTRIEAGEQTIIEALKLNDKEAIFNILFGKDPAALRAKLDAAKRAVTAATYQNVKTAAPTTSALDSKDPLFGPYNPRSYKTDPQEYFAEQRKEFAGSNAGRALLNKAPAYTGGY